MNLRGKFVYWPESMRSHLFYLQNKEGIPKICHRLCFESYVTLICTVPNLSVDLSDSVLN